MNGDEDLTRGLLRARSGRVVAGGRLVLAAVLLGVLWLDPSRSAPAPGLAWAVAALYATLALAGVLLLRRGAPRRLAGRPVAAFDLPAHLLELGTFAVLLHATWAGASPVFPLFAFSILSATFRWGWRGALWTSLSVLVLLIAAAAVSLRLGADLPFELDRFLIRCAQVAVLGAMLLYFGLHQERLQDEMLGLGGWRRAPEPLGLSGHLAAGAGHAAEVFGGARVALVVQDRDEPGALRVLREGAVAREDRPGPQEIDLLVPDEEGGLMGRRGDSELLALGPGGRIERRPAPADWAALCDALGASHLLSLPLGSERFAGRLMVLDRPDLSAEDMLVAALVARQVEAGLGRLEAVEAQRRAAAGEERLRMARDLHDGVLQTLSATAMHLAALARSGAPDPARLAALQLWLEREQRELRGLIGRLRVDDPSEGPSEGPPEGPPEGPAEDGAAPALPALAQALGRQWGVAVEITCRPAELELGPEEGFQLRQLIREGAANAARHGGATRIAVEVSGEGDVLRLRVADDGTGLGIEGEFDAERCRRLGLGPRSLRERVAALGGAFRLRSGAGGLRLDIALPRRRASAPLGDAA